MTTHFRDDRLPSRFWAKVEPRPAPADADVTGDCWVWTASLNAHGYGLAQKFMGRSGAAHRLAWDALTDSPLPKYTPTGPQLDHVCRVRACVNPAHLEVVTPRGNTMRGETIARVRKAQDACIHGHPFDAENTIQRPNGNRGCRECGRQASRRYKARRLAAL